MNNQIEFTQVSNNEIKFDYNGHKFMLIQRSRGIYGMGKAVQLYELDGLKKEHIKEIAWTRDDNHKGMKQSDAYSKNLETIERCKELAIEYLSKLI